MRPMPDQRIERFRCVDLEVIEGRSLGLDTSGSVGTGNGIFQARVKGHILRMRAGCDEGWEHVSVSLQHRVPTWAEMCWVKELFWSDDECVMQLHVPKADWINCHPHTLHLWKPRGAVIPTPPKDLV